MFCDKCGTPFLAGAQYCASCGKPILGGVAVAEGATTANTRMGAYALPSANAVADTRVRRHLNLLAALWLANGILRLVEVGWLLIFGRFFFDGRWNWFSPVTWGFDFGSLVWDGMLIGGILLGLFGGIHLVLAWGLFERQPWARVLGIVVACLALIRIPFGTALGVYTLWVLVPEKSAREWDALSLTSHAHPAH
jgi:uncharacterized membrane protein (DUF2068 family)